MPMVATMKPYTLFVVDDDMPLNPRTDYDNLGKMVCWHSRYNLGDEHDYDEPRDFLQKKLFEMYSSYPSSQYGKPIYDFIKSGKAETAKLEYDRSAHEWVLYEKWFGGNEWSKSSSYTKLQTVCLSVALLAVMLLLPLRHFGNFCVKRNPNR